MERTKINLQGRDVDFSFRRSSRARNLRIQVSLEHGVEVISPDRMPEHKIFNFIEKKQGWILNKVRHFDKYSDVRKGDDEVFYLGEIYKTNIVDSRKNDIFFDGESFQIGLKPGANLKKIMDAWFRKEARMNITGMVTALAEEYGLEIGRITIREQRTRWGSASKNGNLNFNYKLMMAPEEVIRYVVIHELTHLTHMNHSKKFWRLVAERCPDYQKHIRWLKRHGPLLKL